MAKKKKKEVVFLVCEETGDHNYTLRRKTGGEKLKLKKFCPRLRKHTIHNEKKKYTFSASVRETLVYAARQSVALSSIALSSRARASTVPQMLFAC